MTAFNRRDFLKFSAAGAGLGGLALTGYAAAPARKTIGRVVVIGGGFGGSTAAKYLRLWSGGAIEVVLVERNSRFVSCPISNLVLGGNRRMEDITHGYQGLRNHGVQVLHDEIAGIDSDKRLVKLRTKSADLSYDRLVVSPGVDFLFDQVQGLNAEAQKTILHAWKAGPETLALRRQLEAMRDGGVYLLSIPRAPYRCPPGPYERMSQIAHYFKQSKPKSKIIVLDANEDVTSKGGLFKAAWKDLYAGIIDYRPNAEVKAVDVKDRAFRTDFDTVKGDVLNIVPPMRAGDIAQSAGLITANNRWCGVDWLTMESTAKRNIHVLGDATLSAPGMPKSGHMANQHGKVAAAAIIELMNGRTPSTTPMMTNTCYSFVSDKEVIHVASVHRFDAAQKTMVTVPGSGGVSAQRSALEGLYGASWAQNIWRDMLG